MARPLSEKKRATLIDATTEAVATMGTGASTAKIASAAGVSEGTVFTYFPTKDELLNAVYLEIKRDLAQAMFGSYPVAASPLNRTRHIWDAYIGWGHAYPSRRQAMQQLVVSEKITAESRKVGMEMFARVNMLLAEGPGAGPLKERAAAFNGALLESVAATTLEAMAKDPSAHDAYRQAGFAFFWNGLTS
jgi:AcrR family transcriptional regulator